MALRDLALLIAVCLIWAFNNILSKIVVAHWGVPPLFFAAVRFLLVAAVTLRWLLPVPRPLWRVMAIGLLMGAGGFALMFVGLRTASPSSAAVVVQIGVPITTLLSVVMLGERIHWRRGLGIALTLVGALIVMWNPGGLALSQGLWLVVGSAVASAFGAIFIKQMEGIKPLKLQAWVGFMSFPPLALASAAMETGQWQAAIAGGWPLVAAVVFSALVVSVVAHTLYYGLIQRYEANLIAPLTLMTPLATIALGILITNDAFDMRMGIGTVLALTGVLIVALRRNHVAPLLLLFRERP